MSEAPSKTTEVPGPSKAPDEEGKCQLFEQQLLTQCFKSKSLEHAFLKEVASSRFPVLVAIASFDVFIFVVKLSLKLFSASALSINALWCAFLSQLQNLAVLYTFIGVIYWHSRKSGRNAMQGELLLASLISLVLTFLVTSESLSTSWILVSFFLICTPQIMRFRWFTGALAMAVPVLAIAYRHRTSLLGYSSTSDNDFQDLFHLSVAWAVGTLTGILSDSGRRQAFANHRRAVNAASTEIVEVRARVAAEHELASAQALAEARSLLADREKSANESKSEFISMLCHEIRTPLNGCLASAEMLLETNLDADQTELAHTVRVSGSILLSTVSNFLDFFKLEAGKPLDVVRSPLDLSVMVSDVHRIIEAMINTGGNVELLDPDLRGAPHTVEGDPSRLCGILLNLYMNAAKFTQKGSIRLKVHVVPKNYRPRPTPPSSIAHEAMHRKSLHNPKPTATTTTTTTATTTTTHVATSTVSDDINDIDDIDDIDTRTEYSDDTARANNENAKLFSWSGSEHGSIDSSNSRQKNDTSTIKNNNMNNNNTARHNNTGTGGPLKNSSLSGSRSMSLHTTSTGTTALPPSLSLNNRHTCTAEENRKSLETSMHSLRMLIQDEGYGWLSTSSEMRGNPSGGASAEGRSGGTEAWIAFEVHDTGVGVPPRSLHALFHDYVQGDISDMKQPRTRSGTGLGLAICGKQVAVMGGVIGALSKPNTGSVFWFKVPMVIPDGDDNDNNNTNTNEDDTSSCCRDDSQKNISSLDQQQYHHHHHHHNREGGEQVRDLAPAARLLMTSQKEDYIIVPSAHDEFDDQDNDPRDPGHQDGNRAIPIEMNTTTPRAYSSLPPGLPRSGSASQLADGSSSSFNASLQQRWHATPPSASNSTSDLPALAAGRGSYDMSLSSSLSAIAVTANSESIARPLAGLRILVAEDNLINRKVACRVLTSLGAHCDVASNGQEAVDAVIAAESSDIQLDAVLMDMCMPVMNGVEATRAIREHGSTVPVIAMTANALEKDKEECLAAGMDGFMSKPVLREQLAECIGDVYKNKKQHR